MVAAPLFPRFLLRGQSIFVGILLSIIIIATFQWLKPQHSRFGYPENSIHGTPNLKDLTRGCHEFPNSEDVQIIVKTGANEVYEKLPTQLLTSLRCYARHQVLLFSDLEQDIGEYHIFDILADVTESVKAGPEFKYYRELQELKKNRQDASVMKQKGSNAWDLDKFKFLHMLEKTWKLRPGLKWYVFIEADTYLFRSNLLLWLQRMDASKPLYLGSPTSLHGESFAHGGSGIILSGTALAQFAKGHPGIAASYDKKIENTQYGDQWLMRALRDKKVELSGRWPMIQGESPATLPFGPGPGPDGKYWCQPLITMHHVSPDDNARICEIEQQRPNQKKPFLPEELYQTLASRYVQAMRTDWDNISDDVFYRAPGVEGFRQKQPEDMSKLEKEAYISFENCGKACDEQTRCYQYLYTEGVCSFAFSFRFGKNSTSFTSGWPSERIKEFRNSNACKNPEWL